MSERVAWLCLGAMGGPTVSAHLARELDAAARVRGAHFIDAPVSGGEEGAERGVLTVMAGGEAEVFERAKPLFDAYARGATLLGAAGSGQLTKMVNQVCIAGMCRDFPRASPSRSERASTRPGSSR